MTTTRAEQAEHTRQLILSTAQRLFLDNGYDAASLAQIAEACGITKANVYYYFRTKAEILLATLTPWRNALSELVDESAAMPSRRRRIDHLVTGYVDLMVANRTTAVIAGGDPALRREQQFHADGQLIRTRALHTLFGDKPTDDQRAAYFILSNLADLVIELRDLDDDRLRAALLRVGRRLLG